MQNLLNQIARAEKEDMDSILRAALKRYGELFPDWEITTFSLPKGSDRAEQIDRAIALLESMKNLP